MILIVHYTIALTSYLPVAPSDVYCCQNGAVNHSTNQEWSGLLYTLYECCRYTFHCRLTLGYCVF